MGLELINKEYTDPDKLTKLAEEFAHAKPCKHIVLDNFFEEEFAHALHDNFPKFETLKVVRKSLNENKREDYHFERWHPAFGELRDFMITDEVSEFMSTLTGINGLFTNTDALGQGIHQGGKGSFLDVHIDVNVALMRILDEKFYSSHKAMIEEFEIFNENNTRFLVFGRIFKENFITLSDIELPSNIADRFEGFGEDIFRDDISSTTLRVARGED